MLGQYALWRISSIRSRAEPKNISQKYHRYEQLSKVGDCIYDSHHSLVIQYRYHNTGYQILAIQYGMRKTCSNCYA